MEGRADDHPRALLRAEGVTFRYPGGDEVGKPSRSVRRAQGEGVRKARTARGSRAEQGAARVPGRRGVENIDLDVTAGEVVALLGPNGSGKSTLLQLLGTALQADFGAIEHGIHSRMAPGRSAPGAPAESGAARPAARSRPSARSLCAVRRSLGQATDEPVHVEALTVRENALLFARAAGLSRAEADTRLRPLLHAFGLGNAADVPVSACSFGMRRKLLLVQALAHDPMIILLDEPTIGLDPTSRSALEKVLRERALTGAAVVLATNDVLWVPRVAGRVAFLHEGRIVADAPPADLLAAFNGCTEIDFAIGKGAVPADLHRLPLPEGCTATVAPGRLRVDAPGPGALPPLCRTLLDAGIDIRGVELTPPTLAGIFRKLTGAELVGAEKAGAESEGGEVADSAA